MNNRHTSPKINHLFILGLVFIVTGFIVFLDSILKTGWLMFAILPLVGVVSVGYMVKRYSYGYILIGCILAGIGFLTFSLFTSLFTISVAHRIGAGLIGLGICGLVYFAIGMVFYHKSPYWVLIPSSLFTSVGICLVATSLKFMDFVVFSMVGLGLPLLIWGICAKYFGLVIPGSLIISIGPGIYVSWGLPWETSALAKTGMMLVIFALGWGLIIFFSRMITDKFMWWPLIPGGILAVVGWGLYIGGNPENAVSFIGNTGSLGLMIFGFYLLLMRRGFRQ